MQLRPDNIRRVRDAIAAAPPELFDMREYGRPECGTPGCIAGWATALAEMVPPSWGGPEEVGQAYFGLSGSAKVSLFYGGYHQRLTDLTRADALHVLDWLLTLDRDPTGDEIADAWDRAVAARNGETGRG